VRLPGGCACADGCLLASKHARSFVAQQAG